MERVFDNLAKPSWTPEPATIGLIWQILYPIIIVTFGFVFVQAIRKKVTWKVALPFGITLVANSIFTPTGERSSGQAMKREGFTTVNPPSLKSLGRAPEAGRHRLQAADEFAALVAPIRSRQNVSHLLG